MNPKSEVLELAGREVTITNPTKIFFPKLRLTKLDLVRYYVAVADGAVRGVRGRPMLLKRFPNGVEEEAFYQKRAPAKRPDWIEVATFRFPSGRDADEIVVRDVAQLAWVINLGCVDLNAHPVRAEDMDHPDELRVDLDPVPGVPWQQIIDVALVTRDVLADMGLVGWPKTSGSRGVHVWVRIEPRWPFEVVRRAALALAREVERRAPEIATSKWWKEERHGVFLDYNQNARDRATSNAYSVRPTPDARVSMPLSWEDLATSDPAAFTLLTVPAIFAERGDAHAHIDDAPGTLERLLELADRQEAEGDADAPWPPHYEKKPGEEPRVTPSRAKGAAKPARPKLPVLVIAKARAKADALAGLERWKERHPEVVPHLAPEDILTDTMRGRSSAWTRIRVNLKNVPVDQRPAEEAPDPDYDPASEWQ
ncbi:MAG: DNA polymerase domain-containing protein [Labilithrix sp.]|nr:DNA polymerase domain-containing protein [Labilithrix sp.]MBX3215001.1 DNA polymerase domain-containing protein [Labilithrix sp.]